MGFQQSLEGGLWQKERLTQSISVSDGSANVVIGEELKGVHPVDRLYKDLTENVLDPCTSDDSLPRLAVLALDHLHKEPHVLGNKSQNENTLGLLVLDWLV